MFCLRSFCYLPYGAVWLAIVIGGMILSSPSVAATKNGFDVSGALIAEDEIVRGGPPRDGIPAIDEPQFVVAEKADFLRDDELILGLVVSGVARAYPIKILNWHEIVNDDVAGQAVAVTYCPLCGSGVVFAAEHKGVRLSFGVSGLLYNSDVLLYDRASESLWSQLMRRALSGLYQGDQLRTVPSEHTIWGDWRRRYPHTQVLKPPTDFGRNYEHNPYAGYEQTPRLYFPVSPSPPSSLPAKAWVLGVVVGDVAKAYPFTELQKHGRAVFTDVVGGQHLQVHWNAAAPAANIIWDNDGGGDVTRAFWFAWHAFYPHTTIFRAPQ